MVFLWLLCIILSIIYTASGVSDEKCFDNCSCCRNEICGHGINGWTNVCTIGCIDGHRGARCYELCQYDNCKSCGYREKDGCTACYDGYFLGANKDCTSQCPSNCKSCNSNTMCTECKEGFYDKDGSTSCKYVHCPANCECNGQGECISCKVGFYDKSMSCTKQCPANCITCESEELCNDCKIGFYNGYEFDNNKNVQLNNCTYACRHTCTQCMSYTNCLQCIDGKYGRTCQDDCSVGCKDRTCLFDSGQCECSVDFTGDNCLKCFDGKYGLFCNEICSKYCKGNLCERTAGYCSGGCKNENMTGTTCNACIAGMFGELCAKICPENCKDSRCERHIGICSNGCTGNYNGTMCDQCVFGKYGNECKLNCPINCAGKVCNRYSGICLECIETFQGEMCDECKPGYYGLNCDVPCPLHCANYPCNRNTGNCVYGCKNGYSGDKCCVMSKNCVECQSNTECMKCVPGYFKSLCNETCPGSCNGSCHIVTGECILSKEVQQQKDPCPVATAAVLGSMFTLSFAVHIVLLALFLFKKIKISRRQHSQADRELTYENQLQNVGEQFPRTTHDATDTIRSEDVERNVYEGIRSVNEKEHEYQQVSYDHTNIT